MLGVKAEFIRLGHKDGKLQGPRQTICHKEFKTQDENKQFRTHITVKLPKAAWLDLEASSLSHSSIHLALLISHWKQQRTGWEESTVRETKITPIEKPRTANDNRWLNVFQAWGVLHLRKQKAIQVLCDDL